MEQIFISDFSSIIELSVTMNLAYVIVDYTNSFTKIIAQKVCNFEERIKKFHETLIGEIKTLNISNLKPHEVDGNSTLTQIEELKRKENNIITQINNAKKELLDKVEELSSSKSFSFISFYLAVFGILALFVPSNLQEIPFVELSWFMYLCLSIGLLLVVWFFGDCSYIVGYSSSIRYCSYTIPFILVFSVILACLFRESIEICTPLHWIISLITPILPLLNFLVYTGKILNKSKRLSTLVQEKTLELNSEISEIKKHVKQHEGLNAISGQFAVTPTSKEERRYYDEWQMREKKRSHNPKERIYELLMNETLTCSQIIKIIGLKHDVVRQCLRQLIIEKRVIKEVAENGDVLYKT